MANRAKAIEAIHNHINEIIAAEGGREEMRNALADEITGYYDMSAEDWEAMAGEVAPHMGWGEDLTDEQMEEWNALRIEAYKAWLKADAEAERLSTTEGKAADGQM